MSLALKQEQFVDDQVLRDRFVGKIEVLDKVKVLMMVNSQR